MPRARRRRARRRRKRNFRRRRVRARPSLNYHKYRLTTVIDLVTDSGATSGDINYIFKHHDMDEVVKQYISIQPGTPLSDQTALKILYDMYRVQYCRLTYHPRFDSGDSVGGSGGTTIDGLPTMYISSDPDNVNVNQSKLDLIQKLGTKSFNMARSWRYSWKPKRLTSSSSPGATDIFQGGWINLQGKPPLIGETQLLSDPVMASSNGPSGPLPGEKIGEILIEYYVEFKSKK